MCGHMKGGGEEAYGCRESKGGGGGKQGSGKTNLCMVLTAAGLLRMQLVCKISLLTCQHSHLLLHALHLIADVCCAPLQPAV